MGRTSLPMRLSHAAARRFSLRQNPRAMGTETTSAGADHSRFVQRVRRRYEAELPLLAPLPELPSLVLVEHPLEPERLPSR